MENLTIDDQCDCGPQKVTPPLELVFLLDGSDSFNTEAQGVDGKITEESSFEYSAAWIADFLTSAKLSYYPAAVVSVVQFSGNKAHESRYKPGSGGVASVSVDGIKDYHYKEIIEATEWKGQSLSNKATLAGKIFGQEQLDGNCQLFLALQDLALPGFLTKLDKELPGKPGDFKTVERVLVVISNANNWESDISKLKRWDNLNMSTDASRVAQLVQKAYNKVIPIMVQEGDISQSKKQFLNEVLSKPRAGTMHTLNTAFSERMMQHKLKIAKMLHLN